MKHLISATLSPAAAAVWESWPTKNKANNEIGRSARLSELIESSADLMIQKQALSRRVGHFQGLMASYRTNLLRFLRLEPPYDQLNRVIMEGMIVEINENCWGTVHHDPSIEDIEDLDGERPHGTPHQDD